MTKHSKSLPKAKPATTTKTAKPATTSATTKTAKPATTSATAKTAKPATTSATAKTAKPATTSATATTKAEPAITSATATNRAKPATSSTTATTKAEPVTASATTTTAKKKRTSELPGQAQCATPAGRFTIGLDLGDRSTAFCVLDTDGAIVAEGKLKTTQAAIDQQFASLAPARVALEAGTHSGWISRLIESYGHEVIVANPREVRKIPNLLAEIDSCDEDDFVVNRACFRTRTSPRSRRASGPMKRRRSFRTPNLIRRTLAAVVSGWESRGPRWFVVER